MTSYITGSSNFNDAYSRIIQITNELITAESSQTVGVTITTVGGIKKSIITKENNSKFLIYARWFGEVSGAWDVMFSIRINGVGMNGSGVMAAQGLTAPVQSYPNDDNNSTPETMSIMTLADPRLPAGTPVTIDLAVVANGDRTIWTNRCYNASTDPNFEKGTSEIIIREVK